MNNLTKSNPTDEQLIQWGWPPIKPGISYEDCLKLQEEFMVNPPPCGEIVEFRMIDAEDGLEGAVYWFSATDVQAMSENMIARNPQMVGLGGAARWTSLRDQSLTSPVPSMLRSFNQIAFNLIEAGKGHANCPLCRKTYSATELVEGYRRSGGYLYQIFSCPAQHELLNILYMHMLLRDDALDEAAIT